jgi:hypothetical protein
MITRNSNQPVGAMILNHRTLSAEVREKVKNIATRLCNVHGQNKE